MDLDVSVGAIGLLITLVYVAATVLVVTILIVGLIVLLKVNRLLSERLKTQKSVIGSHTSVPPVETSSAHARATPSAPADQSPPPAQNLTAPHATTHIPPVPSTPPAQNPPAPSAPSAPDAIRD